MVGRLNLDARQAARPIQVLGDGAVMLGLGIALGVVGALAVVRLLEGLLFGVAPRDPVTLAGVTLVMVAVGLGSCLVPALRAARVNPLIAMRKE